MSSSMRLTEYNPVGLSCPCCRCCFSCRVALIDHGRNENALLRGNQMVHLSHLRIGWQSQTQGSCCYYPLAIPYLARRN
jgi:hypothetical protein